MATTPVNHTPGPWLVKGWDEDDSVIQIGTAEAIGPRAVIAFALSMGHAPSDLGEMVMNANLIAAAPDLLSTLRRILQASDDPVIRAMAKEALDRIAFLSVGA